MDTMLNKMVRCYDFQPTPGRPERYVEGVVVEETEYELTVDVVRDTMMAEGQRTQIRTPKQGEFFMDHAFERVMVL